jgi:hypothetical protein
MANIILHQFQGIAVGLDEKNGYLNATKLCSAYNAQNGTSKQPSDWTKTKRAKDYIAYVASVRNILRTDLIEVRQGGADDQGTWIHPDLGDVFASWLSVEYEFKVSQILQDWRQGKTELTEYMPRQLPPVRDAIEYLNAAKEIQVFPDPLLRSLLNQRLMEDLGAGQLLLNADAVQTQVILTVRAKELGYADKQIGSGAQLGKFVSRLIPPNGKTQHGRYPVNVYDLTTELDETIHAYFR